MNRKPSYFWPDCYLGRARRRLDRDARDHFDSASDWLLGFELSQFVDATDSTTLTNVLSDEIWVTHFNEGVCND